MRGLITILALCTAVAASGQIYIDSYRFGSAQQLLLDEVPGATAAYSLRKLRTNYTGNCIQIRRGNDNATQNIGFVDNYLDTAAIITFCGANTCTVVTWYDQSGNNNNVTQATAASQPRIYLSGFSYIGSKIAVNFLGNDDRLSIATGFFNGNDARTMHLVYKPNNASGSFAHCVAGQAQRFVSGSWTTIYTRTLYATGDPYFAGYTQDVGNDLSTPDTLNKLAQFYYDGTTGYLYKNSSFLGSANITLNASTADRFALGASTNTTGGFVDHYLGLIQEVIVYTSDKSSNRTSFETNINNFYTIY